MNFDRKNELGLIWVRTDRTLDALENLYGDLGDMRDLAAVISETIDDNAGVTVTVALTGWAVVPRELTVLGTVELIDQALDALAV